MNTLKKLAMNGAFAMVAAGSLVAPAQAGAPFTLLMPEISQLTAQVGARIAAELKSELAQALAAPRASRSTRTASVIITESNAVTVEATRLPPVDSLAQADDVGRATRVRF